MPSRSRWYDHRLWLEAFLLVNLLTDLFPAMAVAVAPDGHGESGLPPLEDRSALVRGIILRGAVTAAAATTAWAVGRVTGMPRRASTMALAANAAVALNIFFA